MFDELFDSWEAFVSHMMHNNTAEMRERMLRTDKLRFWFCCDVEDREEIWSKIRDPKWARMYCMGVLDRPEVRQYVR